MFTFIIYLIKDFFIRLEDFQEFIKEIISFNQDNVFFRKIFRSISTSLQNYLSNNFNSLYNGWLLTYDLYPDWVISLTILFFLIGPYVFWVTINILILLILFIWYFTIFSYNYIADSTFDILPKKNFITFIHIFKYFKNFINIFKFNYNFIFNLFFRLTNYINYTKESKYNYDMYGNSLILIKKSFIIFFKNILYINNYLDSFYYQKKLNMVWRSVLTFHMSEKEDIEDPEDFDQILLWPLRRFHYKIYFLKIINFVSKYSNFDRFSTRRRFAFFFNIKQSFIFYFLLNIKNFFILLFVISFFNIILLNIFVKILKYITSL